MSHMIKNLSVITLLWCLSFTSLMAQKMSIDRFEEVITDLTARTKSRQDLNGNDCALVKVRIAAQGVTFSGNIMGDITNVGSEYWVYMSEGSKRLTVRHPNYLPLEVHFADHGINSLKGRTTYVLTVLLGEISQVFGNIAITSNVNGAKVIFDGRDTGKTTPCTIQNVASGQHTVLVQMEKYESQQYSVLVEAGKTAQVSATLSARLSSAQEMSVKRFEEATTDLMARTKPRQDLNGNDCALVKVQIAAQDVNFSGNIMGGVANVGNEYWVYMTEGSKRLTIRHPSYLPLEVLFADYGINSLKGKTTYVLTLFLGEKPQDVPVPNSENWEPDKFLYTEVGMNVFPFLGPNLTIGYRMKSFSVEFGLIYGLNKTGDVYYYKNVETTIKSAYNYQAFRMAMRLGYTQLLSQKIFLTPQIGVAYNNITGKEIKDVTATSKNYINGFNTLSATFGAKLSFSFSNQLGICVTPEYNFGISKDDNYDTVKKVDGTLKNWTDGFSLTAALVYKF